MINTVIFSDSALDQFFHAIRVYFHSFKYFYSNSSRGATQRCSWLQHNKQNSCQSSAEYIRESSGEQSQLWGSPLKKQVNIDRQSHEIRKNHANAVGVRGRP